jgi:hypothetical protein
MANSASNGATIKANNLRSSYDLNNARTVNGNSNGAFTLSGAINRQPARPAISRAALSPVIEIRGGLRMPPGRPVCGKAVAPAPWRGGLSTL